MLILFFTLIILISIPFAIIYMIFRGPITKVKRINAYKNKVVYEVTYKRGKSDFVKTRLGSSKYYKLENIAIR